MIQQLFLLFLCLGAAASTLYGQDPVESGLTARYTFDGNLEDATGAGDNAGRPEGTPSFGCGVVGSSLSLDGAGSFVRIPGATSNNVNREFDQEDFTVSLYFKPIGNTGATQTLISKRDTNCNNLQFFAISYSPPTATLSVTLRQNNQVAEVTHQIVNDFCWQHIVATRAGTEVRLFLNTDEVGRVSTTSRVDVSNAGQLRIGGADCTGPGEASFRGLLDETRVYNRALNRIEVTSLYFSPDRILNTNNRIFLGQSLPVSLNSNCGINFEWSPTDGVENPTDMEPTITPTVAGTQAYTVRIRDAESNCIAQDSIVLQVVDPDELDCSQIFLPEAFTPNGIGPVANETFGISNPFAIPELLSFEIYDRYGAQMFQTTDAFGRWDGTFKGEAVEPGLAVWRVVYRCEGVEEVLSGSVMLLR